jgi:hypothetical protein
VINDGWDTTYANHRCVFNHDGSLVCLFSTAEEGWNDPGVGYMLRCWNTKDWSEVGSLQSVWSAETNALKRIPAMCVNKANTLVLSCPGDTVDFIKLPLDKTAVSSLTKKQSALAFLMMKNRTPNRTVPKKYKKLFESLPIWLQIQLQPTDD